MKKILCAAQALVLCALLLLPLSAASLPQSTSVQSVIAAADAHVGVDTAGAAVSLFEGGTRTLSECFGYADIEKRLPVTAADGFELGTLSGIFVALAVQELCAEGKMAMDADVTDYLPAAFVKKLDLAYPVTLRRLLHNTAGFAGRGFEHSFSKPSYTFATLEEALLAEIPQQHTAPGSVHAYSSFGIGLAAYAVECVSGLSYAEFLTQRILAPLQMTHTYPDGALAADVSSGHRQTGSGTFAVAAGKGRSYAGIYPATGAVSTQADLEKLLAHLLSRDDLAVLLAPIAEENGYFGAPLLGGRALVGGGFYLAGAGEGFTAAISIDPIFKKAALALSNTKGSTWHTLACTLLGGLADPTAEAFSEGLPDLKGFEGVYAPATLEGDTLVGLLAIAEQGVQLKLDDAGVLYFGDRPLRQLQPGLFADAEGDTPILQVLYTVEGEVTALLTPTGESYLPVSALRQRVPTTLLLVLMALLAVYFLLGGAFSLLQALRARNDGDWRPSVRFALPWLFSGAQGVLVLLQILVARLCGNTAFASFFSALSILTLLFAIATIATLVLAAITAFTERGRTARVMRHITCYLAFVLLCVYFHVMLF